MGSGVCDLSKRPVVQWQSGSLTCEHSDAEGGGEVLSWVSDWLSSTSVKVTSEPGIINLAGKNTID